MVSRWLLGFTLALQVTFAVADERTDYRDWTPEKAQKVIDRRDADFAKLGKDIAYARDYASGKMDTIVKQINQNHEVRTQIRDSGYDPDTGKRIRIEANVTQTANKAKVAATLADRFKKAAQYAKNLGKASIPSFVGTAAFHGLMNGVDYVMDPENNTIQKPNPEYSSPSNVEKWHQYIWTGYAGSNLIYVASSGAFLTAYQNANPTYTYVSTNQCSTPSSDCIRFRFTLPSGGTVDPVAIRQPNPTYDPNITNTTPQMVVASEDDIRNALQQALQSNNPALATAIAEAIKAAYTPEGTIATIGDEQANGLATGAADSARDAVNKAAANTGSEPSSQGKPGYYKITDGDKTIEGYVYPSDTTSTGTTDSTTTTNPDGSTTTTGTIAQEWPAFCDWAGIVCEFIDWVKEDEQIQEDEPEEIDDSIFDREFDIEFNMGAACPPNPIWKFDFVGQQWSKEIDITSVCDFFKYLGYAIVFASNMTALWIVYSAVTVREQA